MLDLTRVDIRSRFDDWSFMFCASAISTMIRLKINMELLVVGILNGRCQFDLEA